MDGKTEEDGVDLMRTLKWVDIERREDRNRGGVML